MKRLHGKHILLGISGGIAAYKSAELTRRLKQAGAEVRVVMTKSATEFVTPLTFQALSGNPVHTALLDEEAEAGMGHIELARWADAILIAPASANTIANLAHGKAGDLLTTLCLATQAPIAIAPAMNNVMWSDLATQANCKSLSNKDYKLFGPDSGELACGETGEGRMMEVTGLLDNLACLFNTGSLQAVNVVITAGPTYEPIDPVRFIGNRSSGKMGYALAQAAIEAGASVTLISGPCNLETPDRVNRINIESANEMHEAVKTTMPKCDIFIGAAAVADYRPATVFDNKIKKNESITNIELVRNEDILSWVANQNSRPFVVGFAAETENLEENARGKLDKKKLDMIAANLVGKNTTNKQSIGFNSDYNALEVFWEHGHITLEQARKTILAEKLIQQIANQYQTDKLATNKNTA